MGAIGIFLISSFSIRHQHFVSDLGGFLGCLLLVGAYLGFNWPKIKQHDVKTIASMKLILYLWSYHKPIPDRKRGKRFYRSHQRNYIHR